MGTTHIIASFPCSTSHLLSFLYQSGLLFLDEDVIILEEPPVAVSALDSSLARIDFDVGDESLLVRELLFEFLNRVDFPTVIIRRRFVQLCAVDCNLLITDTFDDSANDLIIERETVCSWRNLDLGGIAFNDLYGCFLTEERTGILELDEVFASKS